MKHHSTLCDYVSQAESDTLWLQGLRNVVDETHPCSEHSCTACVQHVLEWILGHGLLTFIDDIFGLFVLFTLTVQLQCVFTQCPLYEPKPQFAQVDNKHFAPQSQSYPLLTHTISDYSPHRD